MITKLYFSPDKCSLLATYDDALHYFKLSEGTNTVVKAPGKRFTRWVKHKVGGGADLANFSWVLNPSRPGEINLTQSSI